MMKKHKRAVGGNRTSKAFLFASVEITFVLLAFMQLQAGILLAEEYRNVSVRKVLTSTTVSDGSRIRYLRADDPEVTVLVVDVPPGGSTGWHSHPVPVYAYMLEGVLAVEMENGKTFEFRKGDAIIEVVNTGHNGYNPGKEKASLVVFYTGAVGVPNVVKEQQAAVPVLP